MRDGELESVFHSPQFQGPLEVDFETAKYFYSAYAQFLDVLISFYFIYLINYIIDYLLSLLSLLLLLLLLLSFKLLFYFILL